MRVNRTVWLAAIAVSSVCTLGAPAAAQQPTVQIPQSGVAQVMTLEGNFVRAAYNNEGYAILATSSPTSRWRGVDAPRGRPHGA